jgi:hypothetical protein
MKEVSNQRSDEKWIEVLRKLKLIELNILRLEKNLLIEWSNHTEREREKRRLRNSSTLTTTGKDSLEWCGIRTR